MIYIFQTDYGRYAFFPQIKLINYILIEYFNIYKSLNLHDLGIGTAYYNLTEKGKKMKMIGIFKIYLTIQNIIPIGNVKQFYFFKNLKSISNIIHFKW